MHQKTFPKLIRLEGAGVPMKLVYRLADQFADGTKLHSEEVRRMHAQTLVEAVDGGIKGNFGLYGTPEWWANIEHGRMPLQRVCGIISGTWGQDESGNAKMVDVTPLLCMPGSEAVETYPPWTDDTDSRKLFRIGHRVEYVFAQEELKFRGNGQVTYLGIPLEIAISLQPVQ